MWAGGSCANTPARREESENAPLATASGARAAATWSQVARTSSNSSSTTSRSTSVMARARATRSLRRLSAWRVSSLPPTTTSVPPASKPSSTSPASRKSDGPGRARPARRSAPRAARSISVASASSARRSRDSPASGTSMASCSRVGRSEALIVRGLELQHQVVLQHARPEVARALLDLEHRGLDLAGLEMRDVDLGIALELGELLGERRRTKVARDLGELALLVGERGLDDQELQVGDAVDDA